MSLAAGIVHRVEGHRDSGPATRAAAHAQQRAGSRGRARLRQRTFEDVVGAPRLACILDILEELRRPVSCTGARPHDSLACRTAFDTNVNLRGLARECRKWATPWACQFDCVAVLTLKGGRRRSCSKWRRTGVEQATDIASAAERAPRARGPSAARLHEPRPAPATDRPRPQPREDAAPLKNEGVREGASRLLAHPRGAPRRRQRSIALKRSST
jgi:hypothetical protein